MNEMNGSGLRMTLSGMLMTWASISALPLGLYWRSGPLLALGILGLFLIGISRFLVSRQLLSVNIYRQLPKRTFPGESFDIEIEMHNRHAWMPVRELKLKDFLTGRSGVTSKLEKLGPLQKAELKYQGKAYQRGRLRQDQFELLSSWPFGFFVASRRGSFKPSRPGDGTMLVVPKPIIPPSLERILEEVEREAAIHSLQAPDDQTDFRSLREYRPGDTICSVHWAASSRAQRLVVRESDPPLPKPSLLGIILHQYLPSGEMYQPDRFENMLRMACGLLLRCRRRDLPVVIKIESSGPRRCWRVPEHLGYVEILDLLAELKGSPLPSSAGLSDDWETFAACDQVFVLGDYDHHAWQSLVDGKHPSIVCLDPDSGERRGRKVLLSAASGKESRKP